MPNPWGANLGTYPPFFTNLILSGDVACPAGSETNIVNLTGVTAYGPGTWTAGAMGMLGIVLGATPPTNLVVGLRLNNGADVGNQTVPTTVLVASATLMIPVWIWNMPSSSTIFNPPGASIQISVFPTAQPVTAKQIGSALYYWLLRVGE